MDSGVNHFLIEILELYTKGQTNLTHSIAKLYSLLIVPWSAKTTYRFLNVDKFHSVTPSWDSTLISRICFVISSSISKQSHSDHLTCSTASNAKSIELQIVRLLNRIGQYCAMHLTNKLPFVISSSDCPKKSMCLINVKWTVCLQTVHQIALDEMRLHLESYGLGTSNSNSISNKPILARNCRMEMQWQWCLVLRNSWGPSSHYSKFATSSVRYLMQATSALDAESEALVQEALDRVAHGRTVITTAHFFHGPKCCRSSCHSRRRITWRSSTKSEEHSLFTYCSLFDIFPSSMPQHQY